MPAAETGERQGAEKGRGGVSAMEKLLQEYVKGQAM
jgi:hypothetical protein